MFYRLQSLIIQTPGPPVSISVLLWSRNRHVSGTGFSHHASLWITSHLCLCSVCLHFSLTDLLLQLHTEGSSLLAQTLVLILPQGAVCWLNPHTHTNTHTALKVFVFVQIWAAYLKFLHTDQTFKPLMYSLTSHFLSSCFHVTMNQNKST